MDPRLMPFGSMVEPIWWRPLADGTARAASTPSLDQGYEIPIQQESVAEQLNGKLIGGPWMAGFIPWSGRKAMCSSFAGAGRGFLVDGDRRYHSIASGDRTMVTWPFKSGTVCQRQVDPSMKLGS